jgi:hypothetical protein
MPRQEGAAPRTAGARLPTTAYQKAQREAIIAIFLFLQKFEGGQPACLPYQAVLEVLQRHGTPGRGPVGDTEIIFPADQVAHYGLLVGDAQHGASCVAIIRPRFDDALRRLVFELMVRFGMAVFDDALSGASVVGNATLPDAIARGCVAGAQRITSPQQLWPAGLSKALDTAAERPALLFPDPNPQGLKYVFFDWMEEGAQHLHMDFGTRAGACNPGTLRALRNVLLKLDHALAANPDVAASLHFADPEANLLILESPKIAEARAKVTMVVPGKVALGGAPVSPAPFIADADWFFGLRQKASECRQQAQAEHGITIAPGLPGMAALDQLLERVHQKMLAERGSRHPIQDVFDADLTRWAHLAGACLGEALRTGLGGQWGAITLLAHKHPVVHLHVGRNCWPMQIALSRIMNGASSSLTAYVDALSKVALSPTPRNADIVSDIPAICHILLGHGQFGHGGLPLQAQVPVAQLDFSLDSLKALDSWLAAVHGQRASLEAGPLSNLVLAAGAYLGETMRRNAARPWQWTNYDDYFSTHPANPNLAKDPGTCAFLIGPERAVLPMRACNVAAWGDQPRSVHAQALQWLGGDVRQPAAKAAGTAPAPQATQHAVATAPSAAATPATPAAQAAPRGNALDIDIDIHATFAALPLEEQAYLRIPEPSWLAGDDLQRLFDDHPKLLREGRVVWAHLVQANKALFSPGPSDAPAEIVYDPDGRLGPEELKAAAQQLFQLKNTEPADAQAARIARHLTAEISRAFGLPAPASIGGGLLLSTIVVARKHLPNHRVTMGHFPVIISDACKGSVMILPSRWWPRALAQEWGIEEHTPAPVKVEGADPAAPPITPPNVRTYKDQLLHVVKPPVPASDDDAWEYLDNLLAQEQERLLPATRPGLLGKLLKRKAEVDLAPRDPDPLYAKYLDHMLKEYPGVCDRPDDMGAAVLSLLVASGSVEYVVETARRSYGLTVFDANNAPHFSIVYRPAKKPVKPR